ncbi:MAG TPA: phage tail tip lysozyme, partial [Paracoccus sp. (in: a-proteobacteria)]|nr:phage tail tip lysozyme [Paracoccus sp. (in: a-proteobacteria)]
DANRLMREELELRPLIAAAAAAEGTEKRKLLDLIEGMRLAYAALAAEERRAAQNDYLRGGAERTQQLQLELALIGQTAETRARILALVRAEQDIRRLGLEGQAADEARQRELMNTELARQVRAQSDAWAQFQQAGESAIDGVLDKLRGGDFGGALAEMLGELEKGLFDLSIRNPLKNLILGTDLGTMADLGGWSGIWDRITGKAKIDEQAVVSAAVQPVQSMMVQAANVTLSGNLSGFAGLGLNAANSNMPIGMGSLGGRTDVQSQIWQFFAAKGLKPHQIAGIMGNVAGESAFNPMAVGDAGEAFGLMQWNDRKGRLFDFIGGKQNLGDIQKQLEFTWHELMTSESGAFGRLMASTDVRGATDAWMRGFERPSDKAMVDSWGARLGAAEQALATFGSSVQQAVEPVGAMGTGAQAATGALGEMGAGMGSFGMALQQILAGGLQGGGDGALGGLLSWGLSLLGGVPGFAGGGQHAGGLRIVGENGAELEATGAARYWTAAETSAILTSRAPAPPMAQPAQQGGGKMDVHINLSGAKGDKEIAELVQSSVSAAIETYDRRALPNRVTAVIMDMRKVG